MNRRGFALPLFAAAVGLPSPHVARRSLKPIRFATWNIACGADKYYGRGLKGVADFIHANNIDVCMMQEVDRYARTSGYTDFPRYLSEATGLSAFYAPASIEMPRDDERHARQYGNLMLSRWPLTHRRVVNLNGPNEADDRLWGIDNRIGLIAESNGVYWATTHLSYIEGFNPNSIPETQAGNLCWHLKEAVPENASLIVGGDFNSPPDSSNLKPLKTYMNCRTLTLPHTWPLDRTKPVQAPLVTLDHIFTRAAHAEHIRAVPLAELSDHAVVMADIVPEAVGGNRFEPR